MRLKQSFLRCRKFLLAGSVLLAVQTSLFAQIQGPGASFVDKTQYISTGQQDPVFVFCDSDNSKNNGVLEVNSPDGSGGWTFSWYRYDVGAKDFNILVVIDNDKSGSSISLLNDGGYKVVIEKGVETREYVAWVFNNFVNLSVNLIDVTNCFQVTASSNYDPLTHKFPYYDPDGSLLEFYNAVTTSYEWKRWAVNNNENSALLISRASSLSDMAPPAEDSYYKLLVKDKYGCDWSSNIETYLSVVPKADFSVLPQSGVAPLDIEITDNSLNVFNENYKWYFFDDTSRVSSSLPVEERLLFDIIEKKEPGVITYQHPGKYNIKLVVESEQGCVDSLIIENAVVVDTSLFDVPNVFTPNGDNKNDLFRIKAQSIDESTFQGVIFNRWGRVVFEFKNSDDAWDGKVNGKMASPGTYFYVITAKGLDIQPEKKYTRKGSFMLIRGK